MSSTMTEFSVREIALLIEALTMAASRHESMGHVTATRFRWMHDDKASRMRDLRTRLEQTKKLKEVCA